MNQHSLSMIYLAFSAIVLLGAANAEIRVPGVTCAFNGDLCGWSNEENQILNWRLTPKTSVSNSSEGAEYVSSSSTNVTVALGSPVARLLSSHVKLDSNTTSTKLFFYYRFPSETFSAYLKVGIQIEGREFELWETRGNLDNANWRQIGIEICFSPDYRLVFETNSPDIAIDEAVLEGELGPFFYCSPPAITCDFEDGFCGWKTNLHNKLQFKRAAEPVGTLDNLQINAAEGSAFISAGANSRQNSAGEIASLFTISPLELPKATNFSFWYHARGYGIRFLRLQKINISPPGAQTEILWEQHGGNSQVWQQVTVTLPNTLNFMLLIEVSFRLPDFVVGLDAFFLDGETITHTTSAPDLRTLSCSFDKTLCQWESDPQNSFIPTGSAPHVEPFLGSRFAMTTRSGVTRLTSPYFALKERTQLFFYYYAFPNTQLKVIAQTGNGTSVTLWRLMPQVALQPAGRWLPARIPLCFEVKFRLVFETEQESNFYGFGLDEIIINNERTVTTTGGTGLICGPVEANYTSVTCNADNPAATNSSFCGWRPLNYSGATTTFGTLNGNIDAGPTGSQFFFVSAIDETGGAGAEKFAIIESPAVSATGSEATISFWYQVRGAGTTVLLQSFARPTGVTERIEAFDVPTTEWTPASVQVKDQIDNSVFRFLVIFNGATRSRMQANDLQLFAFDDIWYSKEGEFSSDAQIDPDVEINTPSTTKTTVATVTTVTVATVATVTPPTRPTDASTGVDDKLSTEDIVVIVVGSAAGFFILVGLVLGYIHWRRTKRLQKRAKQLSRDMTLANLSRARNKRNKSIDLRRKGDRDEEASNVSV